MDLLQGLNEKQQEAVRKTEGPVMAIAGAGSGKTSVLTTRIAYLIFEQHVSPLNILAITFTNKAANEMKERVRHQVGINTYDMWISTFHSMGARILRDFIERLGYQRNFQIIDDDDTLQLVKSLMKKANYDIKLNNPRVIRDWVFKMKFDESVIDEVEAPFDEIVGTIYRKYQTYLKDSNLVDFEDLLLLPIRLLQQEQDVREYYSKRFRYVLVDEFQDTNNIQYELIRLLVGDHKNLFIVGDEDQSIYAFRGANIENIRKFKTDFPDHHLVLLEQNYRSTNTILDAANHIITNNTSRIPKNLFSTKGGGEPITHYKAVTARDEVEYVAMTIQSMVRKGYQYNDFAILYRINSTSRMFEDVFLQKQIPYRIYGNLSFFQRREIKDLTAYLRYILNPDDAFSFQRCVAMPRRGIGPTTIDKVLDHCANEGVSFAEAIRLSDAFLGKAAAHKLQEFDRQMRLYRQALNEMPFSEFIDHLLATSGYLDMLKQDEKGDVRYENLLEFKTILAEHNEIYGDLEKEEMLTYLLEDIALKSEENKEEVKDGVTMLTLHAAKGLEFRVVFIVALEMGMFPMARAFGDRFEFEEERRLMYVGITRAKEKLFLTNAETRQTWGETMRNPDSKFLDEIPSELMVKEGYSVAVQKSKNVHDVTNKPSYQRQIRQKREALLERDNTNDLGKGDKVSHKVFGDGIVVSVAGDHCVIAFPVPYGIKTLLKDHPAIEKKS